MRGTVSRRLAGTLALAFMLAVSLAQPASADTGVNVGPARQLVTADQDTVGITIYNPSDHRVIIAPSEWAYASEVWAQTDLRVLSLPKPFKMESHTQTKVKIGVGTTQTTCRLVGVGFTVQAKATGGAVVQGTGLAQLALQGRDGTEADCLAILPQPPLAPTPSAPLPWWLLIIPGALLIGAGVMYRRSRR